MMRTTINKYLSICFAVSTLMSCSSESSPLSTSDGTHAVNMSLNLGVSGGLSSRELNTWDAAQQVNDMRLYLFRCPQDKVGTAEEAYTYYIPTDLANTGKGYYTVEAFDNQTPYYSAQHNNQPEQHTYQFVPLLESGYAYQILAIGRDDKYADTDRQVLTNATLTAETTTLQDASIALTSAAQAAAQNGNTLACTELFAGTLQDATTHTATPILVSDDDKYFIRSIVATRNVAGLMLYVQNIPSVVEDNTTADSNPVTFTPTSLSIEATAINTATLLASKSAPTDATPLTHQRLGTIDLSTDNGWTIDTDNKVFKRAADTDKGWLANSYLVSNYMMPTPEASMDKSLNADQDEVTFYLHYTDGTHHRYDNVKMVSGDSYKKKFAIEANHLYSIGTKSSSHNEPYDLKKYYEPEMVDLTIEIEPAFEKRHEFETE